jgi:hypothetical protein
MLAQKPFLLSFDSLFNGIHSICPADSRISATVLVLSSVQDSQHLSRWLMILYKCLHYPVSEIHRISGHMIRSIPHASSCLCAIFLATPLPPLSTLTTGRPFFPTSPPDLAHPMPLYTIFQN